MSPQHKKIVNVAASVRARLLNKAKNEYLDYNLLVLRYFQERFLYRLYKSTYNGNFILKGAMSILLLSISPARPTKDIDFLGVNITNKPEEILQIIRSILEISCDDDVQFSVDTIQVERIVEEKIYPGIRVKFSASLDTIKRLFKSSH